MFHPLDKFIPHIVESWIIRGQIQGAVIGIQTWCVRYPVRECNVLDCKRYIINCKGAYLFPWSYPTP